MEKQNFILYGEDSIRKLESAMVYAMRATGGAAWLGDFQKTLYSLTREQFDAKLFLPNSYFNREYRGLSDKETEQNIEDTRNEREIDIKANLVKRSRAALKKVARNSKQFQIKGVLEFLREYCHLGPEDSLEPIHPSIKFSEISDPRILEAHKKIYSRRTVSREWGDPKFLRYGDSSKLYRKFLEGKLGEEIVTRTKGKLDRDLAWEMEKINDFREGLEKRFRVLIGNLQLVYTDERGARKLVEEYATPNKPKMVKKVEVGMKI